jgi:predicted DsbA family dithiol-disulfide isomerase
MIAYLTNPNRQSENKPTTSECNAAIFHAMYEKGENVSFTETLVQIAISQLGVSESEAGQLRTHLDENAGSEAVVKEIQEGRKKYNINGVPFFVIGASREGQYVGRPYCFSGAQDSETFENIFRELSVLLE